MQQPVRYQYIRGRHDAVWMNVICKANVEIAMVGIIVAAIWTDVERIVMAVEGEDINVIIAVSIFEIE